MNNLIERVFGFDPFSEQLRAMDNLVKAAYPKYNLIKNDDGSFSLEIAVAGFKKDELNVEQKNNTLLIEGKSPNELRSYLHKGISTKPFKLIFPISIDWKLKTATLLDGILKFTFITQSEGTSNKVIINTTPEVPALEEKSV